MNANDYARDIVKSLTWGTGGVCDSCGAKRRSLSHHNIGPIDDPEPFAVCFTCVVKDARGEYRVLKEGQYA